ncbi:hypothetical protein V2P11_08430, partial [Parageobacillus toebii]
TPGCSLTATGEKASDEQIQEWLSELVMGGGFAYGYRKLTIQLRRDHQLVISKKKKYIDGVKRWTYYVRSERNGFHIRRNSLEIALLQARISYGKWM